MIELLKRAHWLQTLVVRFISLFPPPIEHNIGKTMALKKAFYFAFLEQIVGDYLEFGIFEGTSLIAAFECDKTFNVSSSPLRTFWGFDSFAGFKYFDKRDQHPFFKEGDLASNYEQTNQRLAKHFKNKAPYKLVKGYFENTLQHKTALDFDISKISVALIDCDLGVPALLTLNFMKPALQNGTVLILDDYFAYKGSHKRGVAAAFKQFQSENPHLIFRRMFDYGHGGQGFVLAGGAEERT